MSCSRCNSTGYIAKWKHIENGVCFACNGTGNKRIADLGIHRVAIANRVKEDIEKQVARDLIQSSRGHQLKIATILRKGGISPDITEAYQVMYNDCDAFQSKLTKEYLS